MSGMPSPLTSADITADLWRKLAFISSIAAACGLSRTSVGSIRDKRGFNAAACGKWLCPWLGREGFDLDMPRRVDELGLPPALGTALAAGTALFLRPVGGCANLY